MDSVMGFIGAVFRTPFALIGLVLATVYGLVRSVWFLLVGLLWLVFGLPLTFVASAMGGSRRGSSPSQRFSKSVSDAVGGWQYWMKESWELHPDLCRWWATGSASSR